MEQKGENMYKVSKELKDRTKELNEKLKTKYNKVFQMSKNEIISYIEENIGEIIKLESLPLEELKKYYEKGGIIGVDGSKNRIGSASPHFVELYQGLAKCTKGQDSSVYKGDFYTPLYNEEEKNILNENEVKTNSEEKILNYKLSKIEVDAALEGINKFNPSVVMMDGSLIRYNIECNNEWIKLKDECEKRKIILIGVIKEIETSIIGNSMIKNKILKDYEIFGDREMLYGLLEYKDMILIETNVGNKNEAGLSSAFIRSSFSPTAIGLDILESQRDRIIDMGRLVVSLTAENSRGVPLWLDIVDKEVKISDKMMRGILETALDREILEKLFISERDKRWL